jgi:MoxR-like ATPase
MEEKTMTLGERLRLKYAQGPTPITSEDLSPEVQVHSTETPEPELEEIGPEKQDQCVSDSVINKPTTRKPKTVKFGKVEIEVRQDLEPDDLKYVPGPTNYTDSAKLLEKVALAIRDNIPMLLVGETGVGKTSAIRYVCHKANIPMIRINLSGGTTEDDLLGKTLLNKDGTYFQYGPVPTAMKRGYLLVVDEVNFAQQDVLSVLHSLTDDDRFIVLIQNEGEVLRPDPRFRIFATMNPSDRYNGTKPLNQAFQGRWELMSTVTYPTNAQERRIVSDRFPNLTTITDKDLDNMIGLASEIRKSFAKGACEYAISPRDLLAWVRITECLGDLNEAAEHTIIPKAPAEERKGLRDLLKLRFGLGIHDYIPNCKVGNSYDIGDKVVLVTKELDGSDTRPVTKEQLEDRNLEVHLLEIKGVDTCGSTNPADYRYSIKVLDSTMDKDNEQLKSYAMSSVYLGTVSTTKYLGLK